MVPGRLEEVWQGVSANAHFCFCCAPARWTRGADRVLVRGHRTRRSRAWPTARRGCGTCTLFTADRWS